MVVLLSFFVIRNFRGTFSSVEMLCCRNAEGVYGRRLGNPVY